MELKWTLQYSQTVWSLCGHRVVPPRGFRGFCFLGFVERFFQTLVGDGMAGVDWTVDF